LVNKQNQTNKELVSKANRLKFESEKIFALNKKAQDTVVPTSKPRPPPSKEPNLFAEFSSGPLSSTTASSKGAPTYQMKICACGEPDPQFKGYCENCVKKLKAKFDKLLERFNKSKTEYDSFNSQDIGKADEKLKLLKNKMAQYGAIDMSMVDVV